MSREIKFRGYHEQADDMVFFELGQDNMRAWSEMENESYSFWLQNGHPVMQFTGLKDRNGVDIYEGDVLCFPKYENTKHIARWAVTWDNVNARYCDWHPKAEAEIIGNIHQNPELLGGESDG